MSAAQDAVARYLANTSRPRPPRPAPKQPTAAQASAAGERVGDAYNQAYGLGDYRVHTDSVKVDPVTGDPVFPGAEPKPPEPTDWSAYLDTFGLPADVLKEINVIFRRAGDDPTRATALAIGYVRGTDWYQTAYPGIGEAIAKGVVRDEREYRARMNSFSQLYRQYAQRDITPAEYAQHLREGVSVDTVGSRFQGAALATTYGNDWQYTAGAFGTGRLDATQLKTLGEQNAGLSSQPGIGLQKMVEEASGKLRRVFEGVLATGTLAGTQQDRARQAPDIGR